VRVLRVYCHGFGPHQNAELVLAPGMNVVYGPNEAGKSSWHNALYAGLCGVRKGKGLAKEDREFTQRHRPWDGGSWEVTVELELAEIGRVEVRQDLTGRTASSAKDAARGVDLTDQILNDGSPDASRWLGLDRRSFPFTACVRQADILGVLEDPDALQEQLQAAAATGMRDKSAAQALDRLEEFRKEHVGIRHPISKKPLQSGHLRLARAQNELQRATQNHAAYVERLTRAEGLRKQAERAELEVIRARAVQAKMRLERLEADLQRIEVLRRRAGGAPPPPFEEDEALEQNVTETLAVWEARPSAPALHSGPSSAELRDRVASLPAEETPGDRAVHPSILNAMERHDAQLAALRFAEADEPQLDPPPAGAGTTADELRMMARELELILPEMDPAPQERRRGIENDLRDLSSRTERQRQMHRRSAVALVGGVLVAVLGLFFPELRLPLVMVGAALVVISLIVRLRVTPGSLAEAKARLLEELRVVEHELGRTLSESENIATRRQAAAARAAALGVHPDAESIRRRAAELDAHAARVSAHNEWQRRVRQATDQLEGLERAVRDMLRGRGVVAEGDIRRAFQNYRSDCEARERTARAVAERLALERQLADRTTAEAAASAAKAKRATATAALRKASALAGVEGPDEATIAGALRDWLENRKLRRLESERARQAWREQEVVLRGRSLDELVAEIGGARQRLDALAREAGVSVTELQRDEDIEERIERRRREAEKAHRVAAEEVGKANELEATLGSVSEAEEEVALARAELERVQRLDRTLAATIRFIEAAQERVHRDIAETLSQAVRPWLPAVTDGRYVDIRVDPPTLKVEVKERRAGDGVWRRTDLLSHGTAEQIYLLLRIAMAEHLTTTGESCPLLLDDVTAQCDEEGRKQAVLDLLHALSRERQVVLFTQEREVLRWAEEKLSPEADRLIRLPKPQAAFID
jgi:DNA repair exonuclease SbcCD ATPase subunit